MVSKRAYELLGLSSRTLGLKS
ncbi:uncharacterized protein FTOL_13705 [Fusarium torulosum]|uniref:Uncharacterized protein n=1 Tax=Fusarium torulosum TaxID=33205 RepID=A0AAE8MMW2_9HYPO|nr:uncharacterized protein FTOL_13705 [Fusarium torulosum]